VRPGKAPLLPYSKRLGIASEHADGNSLNAVAVALNAEGTPTAKVGRWYASTIIGVIT
jgi:Recombinase